MIPIYPVVMRRGVDDIVGQGLGGDPITGSIYMLWGGNWEPKDYKPYTIVAHSGAMWLAGAENTSAEPGTNSDWTMMVGQPDDSPGTTRLASTNMVAFTWVGVNADGEWEPTTNQNNEVVAIVTQTIESGEPGIGITDGFVTNGAWNLEVGSKYFLGTSGNMVLVPPPTNHLIILGEAFSTTVFLVKIQHVVNLGEN
jgi:hypothetical protein